MKSKHRVRVPTLTIESFSTFISFLQKMPIDDVLFRGQREDWPLLPSIARLRLRLGLVLLRTEKAMLSDFKLQAPSLLNIVPNSDWEWLSVAQHSHMATRLVDWTTNPLAALWFAVEKPAGTRRPVGKPRKPGVVWVFKPRRRDYVKAPLEESPFSQDRTLVYRPKHIAKRITAQSGWFTVHKYLKTEHRFIPLERQARYQGTLNKFIIPAACFSAMRYELDRCGVNTASMLTDLEGLGRHIEWSHSLLEDEME